MYEGSGVDKDVDRDAPPPTLQYPAHYDYNPFASHAEHVKKTVQVQYSIVSTKII